MKMKKLLAALLTGAMALSMAGCGGGGSTGGSSADAGSGSSAADAAEDTGNEADTSADTGSGGTDGDVVEIRFTEWDGGDTLAVYEEVAEKFNSTHPGIHVTVMNIPDEYDTKITTMIAGNDTPEVCCMNSDTLLFPLAEEGIVANLQEYIDKDPEFDKECVGDQFKYMLNADYMAGYGVGSENITMFYNPSLFEQYGVEEPPASYADAWDWDTFVENAPSGSPAGGGRERRRARRRSRTGLPSVFSSAARRSGQDPAGICSDPDRDPRDALTPALRRSPEESHRSRTGRGCAQGGRTAGSAGASAARPAGSVQAAPHSPDCARRPCAGRIFWFPFWKGACGCRPPGRA